MHKSLTYIILIAGTLVISIALGIFIFSQDNDPDTIFVSENHNELQQQSSYEIEIYKDNNVSVTYLWPNAHKYISNEESEVHILNNSPQTVEIINPYLTIHSSELFRPASEGFESYTSKTSDQKVSRVIIYDSIPESSLLLNPGEYGNLHWHFLFNDSHAQSGIQTANIKLGLKTGEKVININEEMKREISPIEHFESSAEHPVEEQIRKHEPGH